MDAALEPAISRVNLNSGESLMKSAELLVVRTPILHPNGLDIGDAIVGLKRGHVEAHLLAVRKKQLLLLLPLLGISILLTMVMMSTLLRPISTIRTGLERIGKGDLTTRVDVSSHTEFSVLAHSINDMADKLRSAQEEVVEKERLAHEMALAHDVQRSLLPRGYMDKKDFLIAGAQDAAAEVGGDYYDVFLLDDGRVGVIVADVAGKGLGGCLVTSMLAVLIRTLRTSFSSPSDLIVALEASIIDSLRPATFITMFYGLLDTTTGTLTYASAGHNPVLHYEAASNEIKLYETEGIPFGLVRGDVLRTTLSDCVLQIAPGDLVLATTDGLNEAVDTKMTEFGFARLAETVLNLAPHGCSAAIEGLQKAVTDWEEGQPALDDKTLVAIGRSPVPTRNDSAVHANGHSEIPANIQAFWMTREEGDHCSLRADLRALHDIGPWLRRCRFLEHTPGNDLALIEQGLYEIVANIAEHGYLLDSSKTIDLWWLVPEAPKESCEGLFLIRDHGQPASPKDWPRVESRRKYGRGYGREIIAKTITELEIHANTREGNLTLARVSLPYLKNPVR
jgi:serine phosphatase RsbU (regulator of sigma subunit)/anti-sigma regulatory factor (Ser/Thr protein kinase)